jgi:hypothetical protein
MTFYSSVFSISIKLLDAPMHNFFFYSISSIFYSLKGSIWMWQIFPTKPLESCRSPITWDKNDRKPPTWRAPHRDPNVSHPFTRIDLSQPEIESLRYCSLAVAPLEGLRVTSLSTFTWHATLDMHSFMYLMMWIHSCDRNSLMNFPNFKKKCLYKTKKDTVKY